MEIIELFNWFEKNGRKFPWRRTEDPYKILVSEILLQKTSADQVVRIYHKFFNRFNTIEKLKDSDIEDIEELIMTLGLVKRSRFLKDAANAISDKWDGKIPQNPGELKKITGIGDYTANAIANFAFEERCPIIDSNIARIFRRYFGLKREKSIRRDNKLWEIAEKKLPRDGKSAKKFNLALIDLGALICTNRNPKCECCPLKNGCLKVDEEYD